MTRTVAKPTPFVRLQDHEKVQRALKLAGPYKPIIWYFLDAEKGMRNGGRDPAAPDCATHWKDGNGKVWATADCTAFACWTQGIPRKMAQFGPYQGRINTDAMLDDADDPRPTVFRHALRPRPGCLLVMPGVFDAMGKRLSPGHVGVITDIHLTMAQLNMYRPDEPPNSLLGGLSVTHCSPRHHKLYGQAIATTDGHLWGSRRWRILELVL